MNIPYRISQIKTTQFAAFPDKVDYDKIKVEGGFGIETSFNFSYNSTLSNIRCSSLFKYYQEENLFLICEVQCYFDIAKEGTEQLIEKKEVPVDFLQYMATIATGTTRGIIHAKTEGTALNQFVLPPINLTEAIKTSLPLNPDVLSRL